MKSQPTVYAVLLTWNQRADTLECLESLFRMSYPDLRVVLVDNASTDGTLLAVLERFPQVHCLANEVNEGFAAAINQGCRYALEQGAPYVLILNNDTVAAPDMLTHLMAHVAPDVGMLVPKIYFHAQPNVIWSVGAEVSPWTLETVEEARGSLDQGQWETVRERSFVTMCAALLPRAVLEQVGVLDERFFYYFDDIDWSLRVREAGFRILLVPQAKLWHNVASASGGLDTPYERYWMARSGVLYFRKHIHGWRWWIVVPYRLGSAVRTSWRLLWRRRPASLLAYWRGLWDGVRR